MLAQAERRRDLEGPGNYGPDCYYGHDSRGCADWRKNRIQTEENPDDSFQEKSSPSAVPLNGPDRGYDRQYSIEQRVQSEYSGQNSHGNSRDRECNHGQQNG